MADQTQYMGYIKGFIPKLRQADIIFKTGNRANNSTKNVQRRPLALLRSFNLLWSLSALWFITALFALQFAPLTAADPDQDTALINSALQNQLALLPHAPLERSSGAALAAPVRAILTPVLHFSNKPLPDSGNNSFTLVKIDGLSINYHSAYHVVLLPAADFLPAVAAADARAPPLSFS